MSESFYVGLDLGSSQCYQTVINADGALCSARSIPTSEQNLRSAFTNLQGDVHVHLEAGEISNWVASIIQPLVSEVIVSHPRSLAWIGKGSNKDDKVDARKLAELLRSGRVHRVFYQSDNSRQTFKYLFTHYEQLWREQARFKSKIKARLRTPGIIRKDSHLFSMSGQTALLDQIESVSIKQMLTQSFAVLDQMLASFDEAKQAMIEFSRQFQEVELLQTAPGVSALSFCVLCGTIPHKHFIYGMILQSLFNDYKNYFVPK